SPGGDWRDSIDRHTWFRPPLHVRSAKQLFEPADGRRKSMLTALNTDALREQVRGDVIGPEDGEYEKARGVFNAMIQRRPAVIIRPANASDVITAVDFARVNDLPLAIRDG